MIVAINDPLSVNNPTEFLQNQVGVFEVMSPHGHVFEVTCRHDTEITIRSLSGILRTEKCQAKWRIRKLCAAAGE